jgi:Tol biopolymer transport system component
MSMSATRRATAAWPLPVLLALTCVAAGCREGAPLDRAPASGPPRGEIAVFRAQAGSPPRYEIVLLPADGGDARTLVGEEEGARPRLFERPAWSPDGLRLVVTLDRGEGGGRVDSPTDLYVVDPEGSRRRLTETGDAFGPAWSPDGTTIVFSRLERAGPPRASLWTIAADGGEPRRLLPSEDDAVDVAGSLSPDGSLLAFTRTSFDVDTGAGRSAIHVVGLDGTGLRRLADRAADPAWSPDGRHIAFAGDRDEHGQLSYGDSTFHARELYLMDADGGSPRRLTETHALNERRPAWSPDGAWLAFQRGEQHQNAEAIGLFRIPAAGGEAEPVAHDETRAVWYAAPAWRPGTRDSP